METIPTTVSETPSGRTGRRAAGRWGGVAFRSIRPPSLPGRVRTCVIVGVAIGVGVAGVSGCAPAPDAASSTADAGAAVQARPPASGAAATAGSIAPSSETSAPDGKRSSESVAAGAPTSLPVRSRSEGGWAHDAMVPTTRLPTSAAPADKHELERESQFVVEQLQALLPGQSAALHVAALLNAQLHRTEEAARLWEKCIQLDPDTEAFYVNLAAVHLDRGESEQAEEVLRRAIARGADSPNVLHHLGVALLNLGRADEAAEIAKRVVDQYPDSGGHWLILGQAQLKLGRTEDAETSLRRAIELGSGGKAAYFALFNACLRNGKREEALKYRDIYLRFDTEESVSAQDRYQVLSEAEARSVAVTIMSESAALYIAARMWEEAEHLLLRILALDPENHAACEDLVRVYEARGLLANELTVRQRIAELDPLNLMNYLRVAKTASQLGQVALAEANIKYAISMAPQTITGYSAMTDFLLEQGRPDKAQWYIEHALLMKPSPEGYRLLAKVLQARGLEQPASEALATARALERSASEQSSEN